MKKMCVYILMFCVAICCSACVNEERVNSTTISDVDSDDGAKLTDKEFLLNTVQGYWTKGNELGGIDFVYFNGDSMVFGTHEGHVDRTGYITEVSGSQNSMRKTFSVKVRYPALDDWYGERVQLKVCNYTVVLFNDELIIDDDKYSYHGMSLDAFYNVSNNGSKSYISPNTWYKYSSNSVIQVQNAEIKSDVLISKGQVFMLNYYPVCSNCSIRSERLEMTGVSYDMPISEAHSCEFCGKVFYSKFKVQY